jgi:hypothetical protein
MKLRPASLCLLTLGLGLFTACQILPPPQADNVRYFTLGTPVVADPVTNATLVRPVQLAGFLHRREMAVRTGPHEVIYIDDIRWAGPLDEAVTQQLQDRLGLVGSGAAVTVDVQRCELDRSAGNTVHLTATYIIMPAGGTRADAIHGAFTATPRNWDGKDYSGVADLLHRAVADLGDAIASALPVGK